MNQYSYFCTQILSWYQQHGRHDLPWRSEKRNPYTVWVSEIMLQQTQVSRVIGYYNRFLGKFPTVFDLANASWEEFLPYYQGLGYYNRGRNMLTTAQKVVSEFGGEFPADKDQLKKLPGIGEYTANAILSFGFGLPHLSFDTNHQRVWGRYLLGDKNAKVDPLEIEKNLSQDIDFNALNSAIMDFSSLVYTNKNPQIEDSPLQKYCVFCQTQGELEIVQQNLKNSFPSKTAQVFLFLHRNHQVYFSQNKDTFSPFVLPSEFNTREKIKEYFLEKYNLVLSVRPAYKKDFVLGEPTLFIRAQILLGEHKFYEFSKDKIS